MARFSVPPPSLPVATRRVDEWWAGVKRAVRMLRVYRADNEAFVRHRDQLEVDLSALLEGKRELEFGVGEDRLLLGGEVVHQDADRDAGVPFLLHRSAIRKLSLQAGITGAELEALLGALASDTGGPSTEDVASRLWRIRPPHIAVTTIDALAAPVDRSTEQGRREAREALRLQVAVDAWVADVVERADRLGVERGASRGEERGAGFPLTAPGMPMPILEREVAAFREQLEAATPAARLLRLAEPFVDLVVTEDSTIGARVSLEVARDLLGQIVAEGGIAEALALLRHVRGLEDAELARALLGVFATDGLLRSIAAGLVDGLSPAEAQARLDLLASFGAAAQGGLLTCLGEVGSSALRRRVVELSAALGPPEPSDLLRRFATAEGLAAREMLSFATRLPLADLAPFVWIAVGSVDPRLREPGVLLLRLFPPGLADELIAKAIKDPELAVRMAAFRASVARRSAGLRRAYEDRLRVDELADRPLGELRAMLSAYAKLARGAAVERLERLLSPGLLGQLRSTDVQVAAAFALAEVGTPEAEAALERGARSLSARVRDACRNALAREGVSEDAADDGPPTDAGWLDPPTLVESAGDPLLAARARVRGLDPSTTAPDPVPAALDRIEARLSARASTPADPSGPALVAEPVVAPPSIDWAGASVADSQDFDLETTERAEPPPIEGQWAGPASLGVRRLTAPPLPGGADRQAVSEALRSRPSWVFTPPGVSPRFSEAPPPAPAGWRDRPAGALPLAEPVVPPPSPGSWLEPPRRPSTAPPPPRPSWVLDAPGAPRPSEPPSSYFPPRRPSVPPLAHEGGEVATERVEFSESSGVREENFRNRGLRGPEEFFESNEVREEKP